MARRLTIKASGKPGRLLRVDREIDREPTQAELEEIADEVAARFSRTADRKGSTKRVGKKSRAGTPTKDGDE